MTSPTAPTPFSCDTFVALPDVTRQSAVLMGKNSDRPESDTEPLRHLPRRKTEAPNTLRLAYVEIEEVTETYAHVGASPYWCWGHELGLNERGVAIGNEAVFTKDLRSSVDRTSRGEHVPRGLLGMELVRLG
jgi:secernin